MDNQLSIIIPVKDDYEALSKLLPYIKLHAGTHEIIVVEAAKHTKSCRELCTNYNVQYFLAPGCGRAVQMNYGANKSSNNILLFLHADVFPPTTFVSNILDGINGGADLGFFAYKFSPSNKWLDINASFTGKKSLFTGGGDQCQFFRKAVFEQLGGYDERFIIMEDFALMRKAKKAEKSIEIIQDRAIVSSRKYKNNSYLWVNLINFIVFMAFLLGVKPHTLKNMYHKALN